MKIATTLRPASASRRYAEMNAELQARMGPLPPGWIMSPGSFMLRYGREYRTDATSRTGSRKTLGACYQRAGSLAMSDPEMTYVEGLVAFHGIPIQHAFCVRRGTDLVVDPTVPADHPTADYFGVEFDTAFLFEHVLANRYWGLLDGMTARKTVEALCSGLAERFAGANDPVAQSIAVKVGRLLAKKKAGPEGPAS